MILTGALINGAAIVAGGVVGTFGGKLMPQRMKETVLAATALISIGIGVSGLGSSNNQLIPILSLVLGTIIGELLNIEAAVERLGSWLQKRFDGLGRITEGFVTGTVVFVIGAMSIMGSLSSGLSGDHTILYSKSVLDGVSALIFASTMGVGVLLSAVPLFLWQGGITLLAALLSPYLAADVVAEINAVGSLLIMAISLNMLGVTKIRVLNLVPAMLLPILLCRFL